MLWSHELLTQSLCGGKHWEVTWRFDTSNQLISSVVAPQGGVSSDIFVSGMEIIGDTERAAVEVQERQRGKVLLVKTVLPTLHGGELTLPYLTIDTRFDRSCSDESSVSQNLCRHLARLSG